VPANKFKKFKKILHEMKNSFRILSSEFVAIEIDKEVFNNVLFISKLLYSDDNEEKIIKRANESVQDFDDTSSVYSSVSTIIGIEAKKPTYPKYSTRKTKLEATILDDKPQIDLVNLNESIDDFVDDEDINRAEEESKNLHKIIEINVDTESEIATYDKYLSCLLNNDLESKVNKSSSIPKKEKNTVQQAPKKQKQASSEFDFNAESEYQWNCLLQYEEQHVSKSVTTITTNKIIDEGILNSARDTRSCLSDVLSEETFNESAHSIQISRLKMHDSIADDLDEISQNNNTHYVINIETEKTPSKRMTKSAPVVLKINNLSRHAKKERDEGIYSTLDDYVSKDVLV